MIHSHRRTAATLATAAFAIGAWSLLSEPAAATVFRGCFASGPSLDGTANGEFDGDVDTITGALAGTGSWPDANITKLKNGSRAGITDCVTKLKTDSKSGDEIVFYFAGHGGDSLFPDAAEAGETNASDNHIRIGNTAAGAADRMTDDELATLLSGFTSSVTMSVILDSCHSYSFFGGANDLGSVTQKGAAGDVAAGAHLAFIASTTPETPTCTGGMTGRIADGLKKDGDNYKADKNKDGTVTTEEAGDYARAYTRSGLTRCDETGCDAPPESTAQSLYAGSIGCGPADDVCTRVAETPVPAPASLALLAAGLGALGLSRRERRVDPAQR
ncbi:MAG: caspase family protein [Alphaproteobacteria bacterium]|nr:caspase family protein [Alphaproteobacteria bacterium]